MSKLPLLSGVAVAKAFFKIGYVLSRQKGSHLILRHPTGRTLVVPKHKELAKGTLHSLIKDAGLSPDEFKRLL